MLANMFLENRVSSDDLEEFKIGKTFFSLRCRQLNSIISGSNFNGVIQSAFLEAFIHLVYVLHRSKYGLIVTTESHPMLYQIFVVLLSYLLDHFKQCGNDNPSLVDTVHFILEESLKYVVQVDIDIIFINKSTREELLLMLACFENSVNVSYTCSCNSNQVLNKKFFINIPYNISSIIHEYR